MTQKLRLSDQFRIAFEQLKTACDGSPKKLVTFFGDARAGARNHQGGGSGHRHLARDREVGRCAVS